MLHGIANANRGWRVSQRKVAKYAVCCTLLTVLGSLTAFAQSLKAQPPKAVQQSGVLQLNGCVVQPTDITLTATAMQLGPGDTDTDNVTPPDSADTITVGKIVARRAHITPTDDPHIFNFVFHALKITKLYSVNVKLTPGVCAKMAWIGPTMGVVAPGQQSSLKLNGYALTTQIDVATDSTNTSFRGSDALFDDSLLRNFRWHTDVAGATDIELQVSSELFASTADAATNCDTPAGLLTRQRFSGLSGSAKIDFYQVLIGGTEGSGDGDVNWSPIPDYVRLAFRQGAPLYVRAIPLRADGTRLCNLLTDGAAGFSVMSKLAKHLEGLAGSPSVLFSGQYIPAQNVAPFDFCATAIKPHLAATTFFVGLMPTPDWLGFYFYSAGLVDANGYVQPGTMVCWNKGESSFFDDVGNFVTGFIDAIAQIVNYIADLYNGIKAAVVRFVANAITQLGIDCNSTCEGMIDAALSTALTAMGLPPSLPNFDELVNDGVDYLKDEIAEQTGVPSVVVDAVVDKTIEVANSQKSGGGGGLPDWAIQDNGFRPAKLVLDVYRNPAKSNVPDTMVVNSTPLGMFLDSSVPLPRAGLLGGKTYHIPVQLRPDLNGTADLPCPLFSSGPDCNQYWPADLVMKVKLGDWYGKKFAPYTCTQFNFNGYLFGAWQALGSRAVVPVNYTDLGNGDIICQ